MPDMTVVLMIDRRRHRAERVLRSVLDQSVIDQLEVLLFDFGHQSCPLVPGSDHPSVTVIPARYPSSIGAVRLTGFRQAHAPIVAFLEEHTMALPGWAKALLDAFESGDWGGVGSEVHPLNPGGLVGWAGIC
ncbi:MAG: glycosyltransferase [Anaerolineae bacterium]